MTRFKRVFWFGFIKFEVKLVVELEVKFQVS